MNDETKNQLSWFRGVAPYINAYRGNTVIVLVSGELLLQTDEAGMRQTRRLMEDIALLNSLGLKIVCVYGARPQIDERLRQGGIESQIHTDLRVTDVTTLAHLTEAVGRLQTELQARLTQSLSSTPLRNNQVSVAGGNFIIARPIGVVDGVDLEHTGVVRRVDTQSIRALLDLGQIVLLGPLGYSPTGEVFNLASEDVAASVAIALHAEKLVILSEQDGLIDTEGRLVRETSVAEAMQMIGALEASDARSAFRHERRRLLAACRALQKGTRRVHIINGTRDGALIQEIYTRDGIGTMITDQSYETFRAAVIDDAAGILNIIRPLEEQGILVKRDRERLEREIGNFMIVERDGLIIGCAALYFYREYAAAELACVAVDPAYQTGGRGDRLLLHAERKARELGAKQVFVLTTQTAHWFLERGFRPAGLDELPEEKQRLYNFQRRSKVFIKQLA
ncbi:MAG: amino-acid N-acetyltransferase [unclassified Hahellaceae]|nr:amino-acid N-acetyltransferase [Hahellaceae bacterium]|tara:strand:+ start:35778 stop:37130 length:1353 start_codon:yes stop_codon:yes gene_type:complete